MLRIYYYILYRIYELYKNKPAPLIGTASVSTVLIGYILMILMMFFVFFIDIKTIASTSILIIIFLCIVLSNYFIFIKPMRFLNYGFTKDKKGNVFIIVGILLMFVTYIVLAQKNRSKIISNTSNPSNQESLERDIREWFESL